MDNIKNCWEYRDKIELKFKEKKLGVAHLGRVVPEMKMPQWLFAKLEGGVSDRGGGGSPKCPIFCKKITFIQKIPPQDTIFFYFCALNLLAWFLSLGCHNMQFDFFLFLLYHPSANTWHYKAKFSAALSCICICICICIFICICICICFSIHNPKYLSASSISYLSRTIRETVWVKG